MENKATSELLDLLWKMEKESEKKDGNGFDWDEYNEVFAELEKREPFKRIIGTNDDANDPTIQENIEELLGDVKLLKRHKHDSNSGDVLVRI